MTGWAENPPGPSAYIRALGCETMKKTRTMAFASVMTSLVFILIGIYALVASNSFRTVRNSVVQPSGFPRIMAWALIASSGVALVMNLLKMGRDTEEAPVLSPSDRGIRGVLFSVAVSVVYYLLWEPVGFFILTPIAMFGLMYLIDMRNYKLMAVVSVALPLVMWLLFYKALNISVPLGPLEIVYDYI